MSNELTPNLRTNFKAIEVMKMMNDGERKLASIYIHQFTTRKQIRDLFDLIYKNITHLPANKKDTLKMLKLNSANSGDLFNKLYVELKTFIENYIHYDNQSSAFQLNNLFFFYAKNNALDYVSEFIDIDKLRLEASHSIYPHDSYNKYILLRSYETLERKLIIKPKEYSYLPYIQCLDNYYWCERLRTIIEDINRHNVNNLLYEKKDTQEFIKFIEENIKITPLIETYIWAIKAYLNYIKVDEKNFLQFINQVSKLPNNPFYKDALSTALVVSLLILERNRSSIGKNFYRYYLEIIDLISERDLLISDNNHIRFSIFKNSVHYSLVDGNLTWAENFYQKNKYYLLEPYSVEYFEIMLLLEKMEVETSFKLLQKIEGKLTNEHLILDTKIFLIQNFLIEDANNKNVSYTNLLSLVKKMNYYATHNNLNKPALNKANKWKYYATQYTKCSSIKDYDSLFHESENDSDFSKRLWFCKLLQLKIKSLDRKFKLLN